MGKITSQEFMEKVLNEVNIGIWTIEFIGDEAPKMYANETMLKLLEVNPNSTPEEIFNAWYSNVSEESLEIVNNAIETVKKDGKVEIEYFWNDPIKGKTYVRCNGNLDRNFTKGFRFLGYHQDISDLYLVKKEKERFQKLNDDTLNLIGALYDGIYRLDLNKEEIFVLKSIFNKEFIGKHYSYEDFMRLFSSYFGKEGLIEFDKVFLSKNLENLYSKINGKYTGELERVNKLGERNWYEYTISLQKSYFKGKFLIITLKDITSRKSIEEKDKRVLKEAYTVANQANAAKSNFLSRMSHDIRTPMNAIFGMTRMALFSLKDITKVKECLLKINSAGELLLNIINQVLDMTKIEVNKYDIKEVTFKLKDFIEDLVEVYQEIINEKKQNLILDIESIKNEYVKTDMIILQRIVSNVLSNAIKYTPIGGTIEISVRELSFEGKNRKCYQFQIKDNGIGMSKEFLEKIYEPFTREINNETKNITGAGLGMAIVNNLVSLLNGTIHIESQVGKGSSFYINLDLEVIKDMVLSDIKNEVDITNLEELNLSGKKILVVEDNDINKEIIVELLEMTGADVIEAEDGEEAVEKFKKSKPNEISLILMDIQMPVMNGYEATKIIRNLDREDAKTIYISAMTANTFSDDIQLAKISGMNSHIPKPIDIIALTQVLMTIVKNNERTRKLVLAILVLFFSKG